MDEDLHHDQDAVEPFNDVADICQQLMDRYKKSSAPQHRHLLATAAAMRAILAAESLPLTPPAYFAATISSIDEMSSSASQTLEPTATAALLSFLAMVLPLVPPGSVSSAKAGEAVSMLMGLLKREEELSMPAVRALVKCLGVLVGFYCLENIFKSLQSRTVIKEVSKLTLSKLKGYMPLAVELSASQTSDGPKHLEVLHMLNVVKLTIPFLSKKVGSKLLSEINELVVSRFSTLTRHVLQIIETLFESSRANAIISETEATIASLASYVSLGDEVPSDTVMLAATLLKSSLFILHAGESTSWINSLPLVCSSVAGLLTSEASTASHASDILKELISQFVDQKRGISYVYMRSILLNLANSMTRASGDKSNTDHLQKCIGTAVIAIGPERILELVPISLNASDFTCSNIWLVPILKDYVVGASLGYYMEHIMPLAKSFCRASGKVRKSITSQDLQAHARDLLGLLPAFCNLPTDICQKFRPLAEILVTFLQDSLMHENIAVALQVLVNQNKSVLDQKDGAGDTKSYALDKSLLEFGNLPTYSKKTATRNIKALTSCSSELLIALTDLFLYSPPEKRLYLKDAIGCLASVTDSSNAKKIFISLLEKFQFKDSRHELGKLESQTDASAGEEEQNLSTREKDALRCVMMELASSFVKGANEDLIDLIYAFAKDTLLNDDEIAIHEAYHTLSRILEEHDWFCSSRFAELIDLLLGLRSPVDIISLRSRFASFQTLMIHTLKIDSEVENSKSFLILNEIILKLKDAKDEAVREAAYDVLLKISVSLRDPSFVSSDGPYQKLINMIMGYLTGASPHIKSGAVSVLSVLVYKDTDICLSMPDLVPSILSLLQGKALEVIKAVLGFVKVLVSCLETRPLQRLLPDIVNAVLPWSPVSRHHFRSKASPFYLQVTVIMEILLRKCGTASVQFATPDKYKGFLKGIVESRHNKKSSKEVATTDIDTGHADTTTNRTEDKKRKRFGKPHEKNGSMEHREMKRLKRHIPNNQRTDELHTSGGDGFKRTNKGGQGKGNYRLKSNCFWATPSLLADFKSQFVGELSLRQHQIFQKRFHAFILDEFPLGPDRYATLRFAPRQLLLPELRANLRSLSSSLNLDPAIYEALAPRIESMARKLANPNGSMGFVLVATVKILTIEYVDQPFDDLSDSMALLANGSSNGGSTSSSISLDFVVEKLGAEKFFERGDDDLGSCSVCLEELSSGTASELIRMPCSHVYHPPCILRWFNMDKKTCPNCRYQLHVE
ncbi:RRP12-like protein [Pyrus ussuriensis x Pyrus communis]|uniref:RRP12-like protein n=1 Tax=Pyrus ussuriensis x Pyrus communis TaxID=2448454 RepID=A0A5N5HYL8_9ROSA|nr:RRP12-like protein [Pyrus ussuriensis x Pyrus communis]